MTTVLKTLQALPLPLFANEDTALINADCLRVLKKTPSNSVALVVIDPPYGGHTHNQQDWDIKWSSEMWDNIVREVFRVLIPGGHMLVFSCGKSVFKIKTDIMRAYKTSFGKDPGYGKSYWVHKSQDSGRVHGHLPRSQCEEMHVYFKEGEGKLMQNAGTFAKSYNFDQHVCRHNVYHFEKDDCRKKPFPTVHNYFAEYDACGKRYSTFDYKPEPLLRALIRDYTKPGHVVMDICMRHGMTAVACKMEMRQCVGVEIDSKAYKLAVGRFKDQFGVESSVAIKKLTKTLPASKIVIEQQEDETAAQASLESEISRIGMSLNDKDSDGTCSTPDTTTTDAEHTKVNKRQRLCGTPGCNRKDNHMGLCSEVVLRKRSSGSVCYR